MNRSFLPLHSIVVLALVSAGALYHAQDAQGRTLIEQYDHATSEAPAPARHFTVPKLEAKAAFILDPHNHTILYEKNAGDSLPLASLTKIMTAIVAKEAHRDLPVVKVHDERGTVSWPFTPFLQGMLVASSNNAAQLMSALPMGTGDALSTFSTPEEQFVNSMNVKAGTLGLQTMYFHNETGLDLDGSRAGAYGTAKEVAALLWYGLHTQPDIFEATAEKQITLRSKEGIRSTVHNTNQILDTLPSVRASKTGLTSLAGGNLAIVIDIGIDHPLIFVVLGSTEHGRFRDIRKLTDAALSYYRSDALALPRVETFSLSAKR